MGHSSVRRVYREHGKVSCPKWRIRVGSVALLRLAQPRKRFCEDVHLQLRTCEEGGSHGAMSLSLYYAWGNRL